MKTPVTIFLCLVIVTISWTQSILPESVIELPAGFEHQLLTDLTDGSPKAHLFIMTDTPQSKMSFISRALFSGDFSYHSIEQHCRKKGQQVVLQVAAAFTPDWKVIEGFALQEGKKVGQDSLLGQNNKLPYKGLLCIKNGQPFFSHLDSIKNQNFFTEKAIAGKWSLFLQAAPVVNGKLDTTLVLPGIHKRRFFIETETKPPKFGVLDFIHKTSYVEAVIFIQGLKDQGIVIRNAIYLDMGSVSEGYVYDKNGNKYLIGNSGTFMQKYTNLLVFFNEQ